LILRKIIEIIATRYGMGGYGKEGRVEENRREKWRGGKGMKGKGGEEDFRAFLQFQICQCRTVPASLYFPNPCALTQARHMSTVHTVSVWQAVSG